MPQDDFIVQYEIIYTGSITPPGGTPRLIPTAIGCIASDGYNLVPDGTDGQVPTSATINIFRKFLQVDQGIIYVGTGIVPRFPNDPVPSRWERLQAAPKFITFSFRYGSGMPKINFAVDSNNNDYRGNASASPNGNSIVEPIKRGIFADTAQATPRFLADFSSSSLTPLQFAEYVIKVQAVRCSRGVELSNYRWYCV